MESVGVALEQVVVQDGLPPDGCDKDHLMLYRDRSRQSLAGVAAWCDEGHRLAPIRWSQLKASGSYGERYFCDLCRKECAGTPTLSAHLCSHAHHAGTG